MLKEIEILEFIPHLRGICHNFKNIPIDHEDMMQECLLHLWKKRKKFDRRCKPSSWMYVTCSRRILELARLNRKFITRELQVENQDDLLIAEDPRKPFENFFLMASVNYRYKNMLTDREQEIVKLRYQKDYTISEISEIMQTNTNSLKTEFFRVRKKLQKYTRKWREDSYEKSVSNWI